MRTERSQPRQSKQKGLTAYSKPDIKNACHRRAIKRSLKRQDMGLVFTCDRCNGFRDGERFLSYFLLPMRIFSGFAGSVENHRILIAPRMIALFPMLKPIHQVVVILMGPDPELDNIYVFSKSQSPVMITDVYRPDTTLFAEVE